ncbi:MAG TPA: hypothetical protein VGQ33_13945 [Vicinamibacteria bacterium]|nr:hypothetical protein [Vicinamibacteria bacterium]
MRRTTVAAAGLVAMAVAVSGPATVRAQSGTGWLHIRVEEPGHQSKVSVNLPVAIVEAALQAAPEEALRQGHIHLGHMGHGGSETSVADLRRAWAQLKATGDAEFATIEDDDQTVKIARAGAIVLVHVEKRNGTESVRVEVPIEVVDALLSGPGNELDVRAAFAQLQKRRGDIVRVKDSDSNVRIWIDEEGK